MDKFYIDLLQNGCINQEEKLILIKKCNIEPDVYEKYINRIDKNNMKECPHCGLHAYHRHKNGYMICGLAQNEISMYKGCWNDWCYDCGKKLCKNWSTDMLFDSENRIHTKECCLGKEEYCDCCNK